MGQSYGRAKREGHEAFTPHESADMLCPHSFSSSLHEPWMAGWNHEANKHKKHQERMDEQNRDDDHAFDMISGECPWNTNYECDATGKDCNRENCAVAYMIEKRTNGDF